jgi:thiol-disulfide isomerase/thioredoxin
MSDDTMRSSKGLAVANFFRKNAIPFLLLIVLLAGIRIWQQRDMVGGAAPSLQGKLLDGSAYALSTKPAHPVLVHFWATWCPICRAEQDSIAAIAHDNPNVITVAMQSGSQTEVAQHLAAQGLHFPVPVSSSHRMDRYALSKSATPRASVYGSGCGWRRYLVRCVSSFFERLQSPKGNHPARDYI